MSVIDSDQHLYEYRGLREEHIDPGAVAEEHPDQNVALAHAGELRPVVGDRQLQIETPLVDERGWR